MKKLLAGFLFLLICMPQAWANAPATAEGAAELKTILQKSMDSWSTSYSRGEQSLNWEGELSVEPTGDYYAVKLPYLTLYNAKKHKGDIGVIAANIKHGEKGSWIISTAIPSPITFYNPDGTAEATVNVGAQRLSGIWWPKWDTYTKLDSLYENITVTFADDTGGAASIDSVRLAINLEENEDGTWSGPTKFNVKNIAVNLPKAVDVSIAAINADSVLENMDFEAAAQTRSDMQAKLKEMDEGEDTTPNKQDVAEIGSTILDGIKKSGDGFSGKVSLNGLNVVSRLQEDGSNRTFSLAQLNFLFGAHRLSSDQGSIDVGFGFNGFQTSALAADLAEIYPKNANVAVTLQNIPFAKMFAATGEALGQTIETMAKTPPSQAEPGVTVQLMTSYPAILAEAGARMSIKDTYVETGHSKTTLEGEAMANARAVMGVTADYLMTFQGMDKLLAAVTQGMQTNPQAPTLQGMMMGLSMFQSMGKPNEAGDLTYHFQVTEDGQTLLNGADVKALMGLGMGMGGGMMAPLDPAPQDTPQP